MITHFPRRTNSEDSSEATTSTTTPENLKVLSVVPNVPAKPPRTSKKVDMSPKRLHFVEEAESPSSANSSVNCNSATHHCPMEASRRKIPENFEFNSSKGKPQQSSRSNNGKNCPGADKENDESPINGRQIDGNRPTHRYPTRFSTKKILKNVESNSSKGKPLQSFRSNKRKNCPGCVKEKDESLVNGRKIKRTCVKPTRQSSKKAQDKNKSSKLKTTKNQCREKVIDDSNEESSWRSTLKWLRKHHEVGTWIQCCRENCRKWRDVYDIHDPADVPEIWYCNMQTGARFASCDYPEQEIPRSLENSMIENKYNAGSIVWARLDGYPWWPAMVDDCPYTFRFYKLKSNSTVPFQYNVTYFSDDKVECNWLKVRDLRPYKTNPKEEFLKRKKLIFRGVDYTGQVYRACEIADEALPLSIYQRLERFSFGSRCDGQTGGTGGGTSNSKGSRTEELPGHSAIGSNSLSFAKPTPPTDQTIVIDELQSQATQDVVLPSNVQSRGKPSIADLNDDDEVMIIDEVPSRARENQVLSTVQSRGELSNIQSNNIANDSPFEYDARSESSSIDDTESTPSSDGYQRYNKRKFSVYLDKATEPFKYTFDQLLNICTRHVAQRPVPKPCCVK